MERRTQRCSGPAGSGHSGFCGILLCGSRRPLNSSVGDSFKLTENVETEEKRKLLVPTLCICAALLGLASPILLFYLGEPFSRWEFAEANRRALAERLHPAATWIHAFVGKHNRLPSRLEVQAFRANQLSGGEVALYRKGELSLPSWGPSKEDFVVCASTGEWNLYYCSWNRKVLEVYSE